MRWASTSKLPGSIAPDRETSAVGRKTNHPEIGEGFSERSRRVASLV